MDNKTPDTPDTLPALGRALLWLGRPDGAKKLVYALYALCALLIVADFVFYKKSYLAIEDFPLFYALFGFIACAVLLVCAVVMRFVLARPEEYYTPKDVAPEPFPQDQAEKVDHDA